MAYHLKLTYQIGNVSHDTNLMGKDILTIARFFDRHERLGHITNWTVYEYSKPTFKREDLVAECGSNHPINAGAIFWTIFDEEGVIEEQLTA